MGVSSIVIVADTASFELGGEAAMPLRFFQAFRKLGLTVKLLCHDRTAATLSTSLSEAEMKDIVFFRDTALQKAVVIAGRRLPQRLQEVFVYSVVRSLTEIRQRKVINEMIKFGAVDVVFQPAPISPKAVSLISGIGAPTYFGPLNGNIEYPPLLKNRTSRAVAILLNIGRAVSEPLHYLFPAKRRAAGLFVSNQRTLAALPKATQNVPKYRSYDATIDASHWRLVDQTQVRDPSHFLYVGRLVDLKAVDIAIAAIHKLGGRAKLTIVGEGPERERLSALALVGPGKIEFIGHQSHSALLPIYSQVCAQLLPSLREAGGNVCLEGLAAGIPVIATKWGGATDVVLDGIDGLLIDASSWSALVDGFAAGMAKFMDHPEQAREMGLRGRERVLAAFDWTEKAKEYLAVFEGRNDVSKQPGDPIRVHRVEVW